MVKKIQIILTFDPYVPNPEYYPKANSIEDMAKIDIEQDMDIVDMLLAENDFKLSYKIVEEDE
jgi:hypothetical protein